jgi:hypothetical protein
MSKDELEEFLTNVISFHCLMEDIEYLSKRRSQEANRFVLEERASKDNKGT